jgi:hypothetical protein
MTTEARKLWFTLFSKVRLQYNFGTENQRRLYVVGPSSAKSCFALCECTQSLFTRWQSGLTIMASPEESNAGVGVPGGREQGGVDEDEKMEELEGSEEERVGAAGPGTSSSQTPVRSSADGDGDAKDDGDEKMSSGTEDDEEEYEGSGKVAERNRNLLSAGCGKQGAERKKVLHAFWSALWPILEDSGWSKVRRGESERRCDVEAGYFAFQFRLSSSKRRKRAREYVCEIFPAGSALTSFGFVRCLVRDDVMK